MAEAYDITSAGINPAEDRAYRFRSYVIAMSMRVLCLLSLIWVRGWWMLIPVIGTVVLPYFAVMVANAVAPSHTTSRPDEVTPLSLTEAEKPEPQAAPIIVIDAPADRSQRGELIHDD